MTVANAEYGKTGGEDGRINVRTALLEHARRAAGDNDALSAPKRRRRYIAVRHIRVDAQFADPAGDQMRVLAARVQDGNLRNKDLAGVLRRGNFRRRWRDGR